jgi:puromycin-sensitive aminopeptidase
VLLDTYALAKAGLGGVTVVHVVELLRAYTDEDNNTVWAALAGVLRALHSVLEEVGGEPFRAFCALGASMVKATLSNVSWSARDQDSHTDKLLRATVVGLLPVFCDEDEEVLADAHRLYEQHWDDASVLSSDFKATVYKLALKRGGVADYDKILASFYATDDNALRKVPMQALGSAPSKELKIRTLDWAVKSGDVKLQDFFYAIGGVSQSGKEGAQVAFDYFKENLEHIRGMLSKASPSLMDAVIVYSCGSFTTLERAAELESFFEANPFPSSKRRIENMLENMRNAGAMLEKVKASPLAQDSFWTA